MRYKPVVFKISDGYDYLFQKLTEDEYLQLKGEITIKSIHADEKGFNIDFINVNSNSVFAYGNTDSISSTILNKFISNKSTTHTVPGRSSFTIDREVHKHYECFQVKDYLKSNPPIHEDIRSSWNCLLEKMKNPKYAIIYKIVHKDRITVDSIKTEEYVYQQ